jgi:N-carbamoyl-L-amino-acid hydrolase
MLLRSAYATRHTTDRTLPCVLMGPHRTVATGGAFDGTLGVLCAIVR